MTREEWIELCAAAVREVAGDELWAMTAYEFAEVACAALDPGGQRVPSSPDHTFVRADSVDDFVTVPGPLFRLHGLEDAARRRHTGVGPEG